MKELVTFALLPFAIAPAFAAQGDQIRIRDNEVIPVKFDSTISIKSTRRGDKFSATVDGDRDLPEGTKLLGIVRDIRKKDGSKKAYADLEFTEISLPNGRRVDIHAYPMPMDSKNVTRDSDGRMEAKKEVRRDQVVLGSTAGGLILGSIFRKPFEGAVLGALGGILVAETDAMNTNGEKIVEKGQRIGAGFDREVVIDLDSRDSGQVRDQDDRDRDDKNDLRIECGNKEVHFGRDAAPYRTGSTVMVPLEDTARELGLEITKSGDRVFYLEDTENSLKLEQNSSDYRLNGRRSSLPRAVTERDGVVYVPIEVFAAIKRDPLTVNGERVTGRSES